MVAPVQQYRIIAWAERSMFEGTGIAVVGGPVCLLAVVVVVWALIKAALTGRSRRAR